MRTLLAVIFSVLFTNFYANAQRPAVGQWRAHLPYISCKAVVEGKDRLFAVSDQSIYTVEHYNGFVVERLSKVNGLSDAGVTNVDYNSKLGIVLVAYQNTNLDLIKDKEIINITDVLRKSILGLKEINSIRMHEELAFLSCSFGLVVVDMAKKEVPDFYPSIGPGGSSINIRSSAIYGDSIYIAYEGGLRRAKYAQSVNLNDFSKWSSFVPASMAKHVITYNGKLYADIDSVVKVYENGQWTELNGNTKINTVSMRICHNKLVIAQADLNGKFIIIDQNGNKQVVPEKFMNDAIVDKNGFIWFGTGEYGLIREDPATLEQMYFQPNGPRGETSFDMLGYEKLLWVSSGGIGFNQGPLGNNYGFYRFTENTWVNKSADTLFNGLKDYTAIARNSQTRRLFLGTHWDGFIETDEFGKPVRKYNSSNSPLKRFSGAFCIASGLVVDEAGNLWVTNYGSDSDSALHVLKKDGNWRSFRCASTRVNSIIIDDLGQKWMVSQGNGSSFGLVVYSDNGTIDYLGDDKTKTINTDVGTGHLPSPDVKCIAKDRDGSLWVGTTKGIAVIYSPGNVFKDGANYDAQQIIIGKGAGAGYLLGSEVVNDIVIDGANRKWVATNNGVWLISADGTNIIQHFDMENSPMFSNGVNCIGIIPQTAEVFFGTLRGMVSYRGDATEADDKHKNVKVFPNPVKPEYEGVISITGLPTDAAVKITDISGNLVYETYANGGMATWNGKNFRGERPKTGVYLIFTTSTDGSDDYVSKLLFIN